MLFEAISLAVTPQIAITRDAESTPFAGIQKCWHFLPPGQLHHLGYVVYPVDGDAFSKLVSLVGY
jgi:hypothetical protein